MNTNPASRSQKRSVLVLYASETGNAQDVAEELGDLAERLHFVTQVSEMNNFKPVSSSPLFIFAFELTKLELVGNPRIVYVHDLCRVDYRAG